MNLEEYSEKAHQFAIYDDPKYIEFGLINEISEVLEVYAKAYRGDYRLGGEEFVNKLNKECGDVCWLANELKPLSEISLSNHYMNSETDIIYDLVDVIPNIINDGMYTRTVEDVVTEIIECVRDLLRMRGIQIEDVLEQNIAKLSSREESGTIKGSGDSR